MVIEGYTGASISFKKGWHSNHVRDQFQRNTLERGYRKFDENDLVMISDIDEIPNPNVIKNFKFKTNMPVFYKKLSIKIKLTKYKIIHIGQVLKFARKNI